MKNIFLFALTAAIGIVVYYKLAIEKKTSNEDSDEHQGGDRHRHLTDAFSKAKNYATEI
ncbi:MAG: hypothetical protein ABJA90_09320 [Ginsengibacter sp.]